MKITGPGTASPAALRRKSGKGGEGKGGFADALAGADSSSAAGPAGQVEALGSLLALQEIPSDTLEGRRRAVARGDDILDRLEEIQLGLLTGRIPRDRLERLVSVLRDQSAGVVDPGLKSVLEAIELRAAVELAKLDREK